jgi:hypothetical protein
MAQHTSDESVLAKIHGRRLERITIELDQCWEILRIAEGRIVRVW